MGFNPINRGVRHLDRPNLNYLIDQTRHVTQPSQAGGEVQQIGNPIFIPPEDREKGCWAQITGPFVNESSEQIVDANGYPLWQWIEVTRTMQSGSPEWIAKAPGTGNELPARTSYTDGSGNTINVAREANKNSVDTGTVVWMMPGLTSRTAGAEDTEHVFCSPASTPRRFAATLYSALATTDASATVNIAGPDDGGAAWSGASNPVTVGNYAGWYGRAGAPCLIEASNATIGWEIVSIESDIWEYAGGSTGPIYYPPSGSSGDQAVLCGLTTSNTYDSLQAAGTQNNSTGTGIYSPQFVTEISSSRAIGQTGTDGINTFTGGIVTTIGTQPSSLWTTTIIDSTLTIVPADVPESSLEYPVAINYLTVNTSLSAPTVTIQAAGYQAGTYGGLGSNASPYVINLPVAGYTHDAILTFVGGLLVAYSAAY